MKKILKFNMKKFLRFYLPAFITVFSLMIFVFVYLLKNHPLLLRFPLGDARIISSRVDAVVKIEGVEKTEGRVFSMDNGEKFLVYLPNTKETFRVIIVDKLKNDIGVTNAADKECYELFFDRFLFQSSAAYPIVYASSPKWGQNAKLQITGERISYVLEKYEGTKRIGDTNVEIILKGAK